MPTLDPAKPQSDIAVEPEICLNLWWFLDVKAKLAYHLAGRAYALSGTDDEKVKILQSLAATDFHIARNFAIPQRFTVVTDHGKLTGVTDDTLIRRHHADIFEEVFAALDKDLPTQVHSIAGQSAAYRLTISKKPLCCTTCVFEYEDGRLIPQMAANHQS
jgi:hypothetical protein